MVNDLKSRNESAIIILSGQQTQNVFAIQTLAATVYNSVDPTMLPELFRGLIKAARENQHQAVVAALQEVMREIQI